MDKYNKQTLDKVNKLYKYIYNRTVAATELSDNGDEIFAYITLQDNIANAFTQFKKDIKEANG